ncbi:MAG TPA: hypothetical protein VHW09_12225 [Bryobacteraceae bacterium]|nr:hypothetical protein [Bryobacteraceae bacterium]
MALLFAAAIATHILLVAGLRNPTVRTRYEAVRELLTAYGLSDFHETLLELLGATHIGPEQALRHLATLTESIDATAGAPQTQFAFAADLTAVARPIAIDGSRETIARGLHREAMFWIGVTHSRCWKVLSQGPRGDLTQRFEDNYGALAEDLGIFGFAAVRRRCSEIERALPEVCEVAERMIAANREIEDD